MTALPPADAPFQANHWSSPLPTVVGTIAKAFNAIPKDRQIHQCEQMKQFIIAQKDMETLNLDTNFTPFLIAVPGNTRNVHLVFGLGTGFGLSSIKANALQNNFLALAGEFEANISIPAVLVDKRQYCDKYHQVEIINGSQINSQLGERAIMTYSMRI
jgi:hypothetical protein